MEISDVYGGGCPLAAGIDPEPDTYPNPAADDAATTPADEEDADAAVSDTADVPAFPEGTGAADAAVRRERCLAVGLREFGGRVRARGAMAG
jgi:hypothetical protein